MATLYTYADFVKAIYADPNVSQVPFGGSIGWPTGDEKFMTVFSGQSHGGPFVVPTLEVLADIPFLLLQEGAMATILQHQRPIEIPLDAVTGAVVGLVATGGVTGAFGTIARISGTSIYLYDISGGPFNGSEQVTWTGGSGNMTAAQGDPVLYLKKRYFLETLPPSRVSEIPDYDLGAYWQRDLAKQGVKGVAERQYAPAYLGKKPLFLEGQITPDAYQAGYPTTALYIGGDTNDIIWHDLPQVNDDLYVRERLSTDSPWGIPQDIYATYEDGQYLDNRFFWTTNKGDAAPPTPSAILADGQPNNLPVGWLGDPGPSYAVNILTQDLYRTSALKDPYHDLKGNWSLPFKVADDPLLVRYGNNASSTDFLNDAIWRGYYTPNFDSHMARRLTVNDPWIVELIAGEEGFFERNVYQKFPKTVTTQQLIDATPTGRTAIGGDPPNDNYDTPQEVQDLYDPEIEDVYESKVRVERDGSLLGDGWSVWRKISGDAVFNVIITTDPGDTFLTARDANGDLLPTVAAITLEAFLYKGTNLITANITNYNWYLNGTLIIWSGTTHLATNLGALNPYYSADPDRSNITITPDGIDNQDTIKAGVTHDSRVAEYTDQQVIKDFTDDGNAIAADIGSPDGNEFHSGAGLNEYQPIWAEGGIQDNTGVTFWWQLFDTGGIPIIMRDSGGGSLGTAEKQATGYAGAPSIYAQGSDISDYAILHLRATKGTYPGTGSQREDDQRLTDLADGNPSEIVYHPGAGTIPESAGNPPDFANTLTLAEVLALPTDWDLPQNVVDPWWKRERSGDGLWGPEVQIQQEAAQANAAIEISIQKNFPELTTGIVSPAMPNAPGSLLIPTGWYDNAPTPAANQRTWECKGFWVLKATGESPIRPKIPTTFTTDEYKRTTTYYGPGKRVSSGDASGSPGDPGGNGWSPVYTIETVGAARFLHLTNWTEADAGLSSAKPLYGTVGIDDNYYVGGSGLTTRAGAIDIRGSAGTTGDSADVAPFLGFKVKKYIGLSTNGTAANILFTTQVSTFTNNTTLPVYVRVFLNGDIIFPFTTVPAVQMIVNCGFLIRVNGAPTFSPQDYSDNISSLQTVTPATPTNWRLGVTVEFIKGPLAPGDTIYMVPYMSYSPGNNFSASLVGGRAVMHIIGI